MPYTTSFSRQFKQLDSDAETFLLSIPREYHNVQQFALQDTRVCLVFALPHAATILLHEPWCTSQPGDFSMMRCSKSARAILEDIYSLFSEWLRSGRVLTSLKHSSLRTGTSFEIAILSPYINVSTMCTLQPSY